LFRLSKYYLIHVTPRWMVSATLGSCPRMPNVGDLRYSYLSPASVWNISCNIRTVVLQRMFLDTSCVPSRFHLQAKIPPREAGLSVEFLVPREAESNRLSVDSYSRYIFWRSHLSCRLMKMWWMTMNRDDKVEEIPRVFVFGNWWATRRMPKAPAWLTYVRL
jgi:hypothetical protein